jgi:hypothetical protein
MTQGLKEKNLVEPIGTTMYGEAQSKLDSYRCK